jgi:hypothetical protein
MSSPASAQRVEAGEDISILRGLTQVNVEVGRHGDDSALGVHHLQDVIVGAGLRARLRAAGAGLILMIQMPSPEEPRFCLRTRGWNFIVF